MTAWLVVLAVGIGSYALRATFVVALAGRPTPAWVAEVSRFVLPSAFAALAAGAIAGVAEVTAVAAGALVAARTRSSIAALAVGLPVLWITQAVTS